MLLPESLRGFDTSSSGSCAGVNDWAPGNTAVFPVWLSVEFDAKAGCSVSVVVVGGLSGLRLAEPVLDAVLALTLFEVRSAELSTDDASGLESAGGVVPSGVCLGRMGS